MRRLFLPLLLCLTAFAGFAQCLNTTPYAGGSITAPAPDSVNSRPTATCMSTGSYLPLSGVVSGYTYQITSPYPGFFDYITVRRDSYDGAVVAHGAQPLNFTAPTSGTYYVHTNINFQCLTTDICRDVTTRIFPVCNGTPELGNASSMESSICPSGYIRLSVNPAQQVSGMTYQWEVSTTGGSGTFTAIEGKTDPTATITGQTQNSWYRLKGRCTRSGLSAVSGAVNVAQKTIGDCYCVPEIGYDNGYAYINSVKLGTINNVSGQNNTPQAQRHFYFSYASTPAANQTTDLVQGSSQTITINAAGSSNSDRGSNSVAAWIDYNADGDHLDAGERLGTAANLPDGDVSFTFTVPTTAVPGPTRLRVRQSLMYWAWPNPVTEPCGFMRTYGESEDYTVNIVVPCTTETTYYRDADGDSFGNPNDTMMVCSSSTPPSGYVTDTTDCDDTQKLYADGDGDGYGTGAPAACGVANNTDCDDRDADAHRSYTLYQDNDHDGFGNPNKSITLCSNRFPPSGYVTDTTDCDDTKMTFADADGDGYAGNTRLVACGGLPNPSDCDDTNPAINTPKPYFRDADGDGFGNPRVSPIVACSPPVGYVNDGSDCDDGNAAINRPITYYTDADGDGFGDTTTRNSSCTSTLPAGKVANGGDCDDKQILYADGDGDGFGAGSPVACGVADNTDCNDADREVHTSITYYKDNDNDGFGDSVSTKSQCPSTPPSGYVTDKTDCDDTKKLYADGDGDGFGAGLAVACGVANNTDCDDANVNVHAGQQYYVDGDHDGYGSTTTEMLCSSTAPVGYATNNTDCNDKDGTVHAAQKYYVDGDHDGYGSATTAMLCSSTATSGYSTNNTDCDDGNAGVYISQKYYQDADADGYGNAAVSKTACSKPNGFILNNTDCNDQDAAVYPGARELCDNKDNDCNGLIDDNVASVTYYKDADGDGYGNNSITVSSCSPKPGYVSRGGDCNDGNAKVNPGAAEICGNGIDDNCDSHIDENCALPSLTITDAVVYESQGVVRLTVSLSSVSTTSVKVNYKSADVTTTAGKDYKAVNGTLNIAAGSTTGRISITILSDRGAEPDEYFNVNLSGAIGATIGKKQSVVTIKNGTSPIVQTRPLEKPTNVVETNSRLTLHPNPSNGRFIINLQLSNYTTTKAKIELVNMLGQTVSTENGSIANGKLQQTVSMPSAAAHGMYLVRVLANNKIYQQKLIYTK